MHELSLCCATIDLVLESIQNCGAKRVKTVSVIAGELSGVAFEAFRFSFPIAAAGTLLEGCDLQWEVEPVTVFCSNCHEIGKLETIYDFRCPHCGTPTTDIRSGKDFSLRSIEIETDEMAVA